MHYVINPETICQLDDFISSTVCIADPLRLWFVLNRRSRGTSAGLALGWLDWDWKVYVDHGKAFWAGAVESRVDKKGVRRPQHSSCKFTAGRYHHDAADPVPHGHGNTGVANLSGLANAAARAEAR